MPKATREDFLNWCKVEREKGLTGFNVFIDRSHIATVDEVLTEILELNKAIENGNHSPLPESL